MAYQLEDRADKLLIRLDKQYGKDATGYVPTDTTTDEQGNDIVLYDTVPNLRVRSAGYGVVEMATLQAGLGQVDAVWFMRSAYMPLVEADYVFTILGFSYQVVQRGASLDELNLLWTIATRRRRF